VTESWQSVIRIISFYFQHILNLEQAMMQQETQIPVYFSHWVPEVQSILDDIDEISPTSTQKGTAAEGTYTHSIRYSMYKESSITNFCFLLF